MKRTFLLSLVLLASCAVAGWRGAFDEAFAAASSKWPRWNTTPYPVSRAFSALKQTFAHPTATLQYTDGPAHGRGSNAFIGGVLVPDGRVVLVPLSSTTVGSVTGSSSVPSDAALSPIVNKF